MDMFEKAARIKLRFDTGKGMLAVEDLFDLPLASKTGKTNLDDLARSLYKQLKSGEDISFVEADKASDPTVQLRFDIVKFVIDTKLEENRQASKERDRAEQKQKIMALIADKQDEALKGKSLEDLQAELAKL
ncbi:hypothetical protein [Bradyrhizobium sp. Tv2a-2]|uniref:hypothetical protein n=1 Tax=Bradyrhizobium sp. Tv2a-2 TaxID=113395 RepID=UPI00040239DA|nr:hypothetical protein [Bradyrhizobium sp. Tv2a-2]